MISRRLVVRTRMEHYMRTSTLEILFGQFEIIRTQDFGDLIKSKSGFARTGSWDELGSLRSESV